MVSVAAIAAYPELSGPLRKAEQRIRVAEARDLGCEELLAFATSAVRDANNSADVLQQVKR